MGFTFMSSVIFVLLFAQCSVATFDELLSGDAVKKYSPDLFTIELEKTRDMDNVNLRAERDASVVGTAIAIREATLDNIKSILNSLPEDITGTQIMTIRNFLSAKALVNPTVYIRSTKIKAIPPKRLGPGQATILEFDQAQKDGEPESSMVYNIEGTDLYVTILFHVVPPNTYNARIFRFQAKHSDIYKSLHGGLKTVSDLFPLTADDITQLDIRKECGYKVSVAMTNHKRATMQVDVYDCPDPIDNSVLVVTNQSSIKALVDPLTCKPSSRVKCECCASVRLSGSSALFFFPVIAAHVCFSTLFAMFYGIP